MNYKNCLTGILLLSMKVYGQGIKPLSIGDKVPLINITNILNYPASTSNLSAFKNKLVILDFMATNCVSCIKALPRFDSIQKMYGDKLQIILITYEKKDKVKKFLLNHPALKLAMAGEDTLLAKYFPHTFISHEVWLKNGIVKAITGTEYVTAANIEIVLDDKVISWPVKNDIAEFDYSSPFLHANESVIPAGSYPQHIYYTAFSDYMNDVPHRYKLQRDSVMNTVKLSIINEPIIDMYGISYNKEFLPGHILLEVKDPSRYIYNKGIYRAEWKGKNTFCFEAVLPLSVPVESMQEKLRGELDLYLGLHGRTEMRKVNSLILVCTDTTLLPATNIDKPAKGMRTIPITSLVYILNQNLYGVPVIDETGIMKRTLLTLDPSIFTNIPKLQEALRKYGLRLINGMRETEMLVITETINQK